MPIYYIIAILACVIFSAYFSATETAFSSMNHTRMKTMAEKGNRRAKLALWMNDHYDKLITTILIGNNIVNIAAATLSTLLFVELVGGEIGPTVSTVVLTVVILIFGEITPKSVAKDCSEGFAMFSAPLMRVLMFLLFPITVIFSGWKKLVSKILRLQPNDKMSQEELLTLVDEVQQSGSIDEEESLLLHNAIEFSECAAEDILTHRTDLEAVPDTISKVELAERFTSSRFSRLLVYHEDIDNIIGIVHLKDFYSGTGITGKKLADIISPVVFVTLKTQVNDILQQMQKEKVHVAVVLDEHSGTYGIVTMEDILEELVGEIWDEHDEVEEIFHRLNEHSFQVSANALLDDFLEFFSLKVETEATALNSWVAEQLGRVPREGDSITVEGLTITVLKTARHRLVSVKVVSEEPIVTAEERREREAEEAEAAEVAE